MTQKHDEAKASKDRTKPATSPASGGKGRGRFLWLFVAAALVIGGLWAVDAGHLDRLLNADKETAIAPPPPPSSVSLAEPPRPAPDLSALLADQNAIKRDRDRLRKDVERMEAELASLNQNIKEMMQAIKEQKEKQESQPTISLIAQPADSGETSRLQEQVSQLSARLDRLQQDYARQNTTNATRLHLMQTLDNINRKATAGESFAGDMPRLQRLAAQLRLESDALAILQSHAQEGVASLPALLLSFNETAQLALPYALNGKEAPRLSDTLRGNLAHIVSIRRVEVEADDDSDEAHLARAEGELRSGNVEMALAHLEQLSAQPRHLYTAWREQAQGHLDVHSGIDSLKAAVLHSNDRME